MGDAFIAGVPAVLPPSWQQSVNHPVMISAHDKADRTTPLGVSPFGRDGTGESVAHQSNGTGSQPMNIHRSSHTGEPERPTATVVTFPGAAPRRFRRNGAAQDPRGAILLFTGIRYERMAETIATTGPETPAPRLRRRS